MIQIDSTDFLVDMEVAVADLKKEAVDAERERANNIRDAAVRYAPRAGVHDPDEPVLAESIEVVESTDADGEPVFEIGTPVPHGLYQEVGTSKMAAHPYLRPALAENSQ